MNIRHGSRISATLYNNFCFRYFYVKLLLSRTLDLFMLFVELTSRLALNTLHSLAVAVQAHQLVVGDPLYNTIFEFYTR